MGDVMPLACGVALGLKIHPVIAIDTDGSQLLGLSALPTIGAMKHRLKNLLVVILDNRVYESAGSLPSRYCLLDWSRLGQAFGLNIRIVEAEEELMEALTSAFIELTFLVIQIDNTDSIPPTRKSLDGIESRYLFIRHLERLTDKILLRPSVKS
jgi:thiamine pyrophosphate-dependent acetolactate synthase large subunit-like protein